MSEENQNKTNTAKNYFKIWIATIILFFILIGGISIMPTNSSLEVIGFILFSINVLVGVAAFILMLAKIGTNLVVPRDRKEQIKMVIEGPEEIIQGPENSGFVMKNKKEVKSKISDMLDDEIDDAIFQPKEKKRGSKLLWLIIIAAAALVFLPILGDHNNLNQSVDSQQVHHQEKNYARYLKLEDSEMKWTNNILYFTGTLKNTSSTHHLADIIIRLDFSKDEAAKDKFDTRYVSIDTVPRSGAFSFREPIYINFPVKKWWWTWQIEHASLWE